MFTAIRRRAPLRLKKAYRRSTSMLRSELPYLESHLTDHCNLNCRGCAHFSPIATEHFADLQQYQRDMHRLAEIFRTIRIIRLMGGEPLLHPEADRFIRAARDAFPRSSLGFATNGMLLPRASREFWDSCRDTNTRIDLTVYPPVRARVDEYRALCAAEGVALTTLPVDTFFARTNLAGDSSAKRAFDACSIGYYCRFLQDGRLYPCARSALAHYFNDSLDFDMDQAVGIDIHSPSASARSIVEELHEPLAACKWCSYESAPFAWDVSNRKAEDWDVKTYKV